MCVPNRRGGNMIERNAILHLLLELQREPPKENPRTPMPVPVRAGAGLEDAVMNYQEILWVACTPIEPPHGPLGKIVGPLPTCKSSKDYLCTSLILTFRGWAPSSKVYLRKISLHSNYLR